MASYRESRVAEKESVSVYDVRYKLEELEVYLTKAAVGPRSWHGKDVWGNVM